MLQNRSTESICEKIFEEIFKINSKENPEKTENFPKELLDKFPSNLLKNFAKKMSRELWKKF